ncbi:MAG: OmpA family protein [Bacteroidia bacterium]
MDTTNFFLSKTKGIMVFVMASLLSISCNTSNAVKGGAIGAGTGAVIGGVIGKKAGNTAVGAILGAAVGGTAGALIGRYMDKQAEEIRRDVRGAEVERIGEGIKITFDSQAMFDYNSSELKAGTKRSLQDLAQILNKYGDTQVLIEGHTDASGSDEYNQTLSEQRAAAVNQYLSVLQVDPARMTNVGYGESQPVADNETNAGRQQNRRVEVAIYATKKLKKLAKKGKIG